MTDSEKLLSGKRIIVTRAPEQAQGIVHELERFGAEVLLLPLIAFESPQNSQPLDTALHELSGFDWILFTSQNAVRFVARRIEQLGLKQITARIAAVGPATAEVARQQGFPVDYIATNHTANSLAHEMRDTLAGHKVLFPRSDLADDKTARALRVVGAHVTDVIAYRTIAPETLDQAVLERIRDGEIDVTIFSSPSAFHNLDGFLGAGELAKLGERVHFAAIGPTTARVMRESGVRVHIEAEEASATGLADAIVKYYNDRPEIPRPA